MRQTVTAATASMAEPSRGGQSLIKAFAELWRGFAKDFAGSYHPERHYMRGPGPKWRAKYGAQTAANPHIGLPARWTTV